MSACKWIKYSCACSAADVPILLLVALLILVATSVEGQTAQDREWADAVPRAKASGRTNVEQLLNDPTYKKVTWIAADWADTVPRLEGSGPAPLTAFSKDSRNHTFKGQSLSKLLLNEKSCGTNQISLDAMLTMKQVFTGDEPEIVSYVLPIGYDALRNLDHGDLDLLLDSPPGDDYLLEPKARACRRATNGDCLLIWNTAFDGPGQHVLQALLSLVESGGSFEIKGPVTPYFSSNLCQFVPGGSTFDEDRGFFYALLPESNGVYSIEIKALSGEHIKTLTGSTTNGVIDVKWDLRDENGHKCTNESIVSFFTVKLPDSGRSQTLKQQQNKLKQRQNK